MDTEKKRSLEGDVMSKMIAIYCRGNKHKGRTCTPQDADALCPDCLRLRDYALDRVAGCPRMEIKTFCSVCPVHCYSHDMREQIRAVMRYSGPRMLLHHPFMTIYHMWLDHQARKRARKEMHT